MKRLGVEIWLWLACALANGVTAVTRFVEGRGDGVTFIVVALSALYIAFLIHEGNGMRKEIRRLRLIVGTPTTWRRPKDAA